MIAAKLSMCGVVDVAEAWVFLPYGVAVVTVASYDCLVETLRAERPDHLQSAGWSFSRKKNDVRVDDLISHGA